MKQYKHNCKSVILCVFIILFGLCGCVFLIRGVFFDSLMALRLSVCSFAFLHGTLGIYGLKNKQRKSIIFLVFFLLFIAVFIWLK